MQVTPPDDQMLNQCKLCHLVPQFQLMQLALQVAPPRGQTLQTIDEASFIWRPNLHLIQVAEYSIKITRVTKSIFVSAVPLAMFSGDVNLLKKLRRRNAGHF